MNTPETHHTDDLVLLEGPHSRRRELWLVLRAVRDFIAGFRALHFHGPLRHGVRVRTVLGR
jgi:hypothetical protein